MNVQYSGGSRSFAKEMRSLKMSSLVAGHQTWLAINREQSSEADHLTTSRQVAEEFSIDHSMVVQHLKQIGKVKKLNKRVPHKPTMNQKNRLKCHLLHNNESFFDWVVMCNDFIQQAAATAQWSDQEAPKHFPNPKLHQKKGHGHCLVA